jgi:hypothetical protein
MKRFLIPAFFVIHADNEKGAETIAGNALEHANFSVRRSHKDNSLLLDEELPTREVPIVEGETELPHTYYDPSVLG